MLLDIRMPGMDGFEVMTELTSRDVEWPIVIMTGHGEVTTAVRAMKLGAIDFLEKRFAEDVLLGALEHGFALLGERTEEATRRREAKARIDCLSARELQVLRGLVAGLSNKALALRMGISLRTVEMHRANMMERLQAGGLAEALTLAVQVGLPPLEEDATLPSEP